jgi:hypothetical protein
MELDYTHLPLSGDMLGCPTDVVKSQKGRFEKGIVFQDIVADLVNWTGVEEARPFFNACSNSSLWISSVTNGDEGG